MKNSSDKNAILLKKIISSTFDGFVIVNKDGIIKFVNPAAEKLFEKQKQELLGQPFGFPISGVDTGEIEIIQKDRKYAVGAIRIAEIEWEGETSYLTSIRDITERTKAEEALRESEGNLIKGQEIAQMGYWKLDPVTKYVEGSNELLKIFELGRDELTLNAFADVVHPEDREYDLEHIQRGKEKGIPWDIEHRLLLKNGNIKWIRAIGEPNLDENGKVIHIIGIVQDITKRKKTEEALIESEEKYRTLVETIVEGIGSVDKNETFFYVNQAAADIFGYSKDEMIGKNMKELTTPEMFQQILKETSLRKKGEPNQYELAIQRKNGEQRIITVTATPIISENGEYQGSFGIFHDITDRKKLEDELKDSEIRYHNLFENSSEFLFTLDLKGNFTDVNKAAEDLTGYTKSELLKMNFKDYSTKRDHRKLFRAFNNIYKTGKTLHNFPVEAIIKDKSIKYFETSFSLLRKGEQIIGFQGSSKDITERKKAEEQIKKNLKEKEILLKEVHHRVKNNMQVISSLLRLQSGYIKDEKVLELFKNSQNRVRSMALMHEVLYRSEDLANIDFTDYVKRLTTQLFGSYVMNRSFINLEINIKDITLDINLAIPCGLIINELVSNSLKYAFPEGRKGELSISFTFKDQTYILTVKDNGIGISEEIDLDNPQTLGLLLVDSLTKQLRGTLELEKTKGTCFKITFQKVELKTYGKV